MPACIARLLRALPVIFLLCQTVRAAVPVAPYFNGVFPEFAPNETFWTTRNAFPNLTFTDPLWMQQIPGSSELVVLEKGGKIHRFPNDAGVTPAQRTVVLDIADRLQIADEIGLLRMVFHPKFGDAASSFRNDVFLCYSHRPEGTPASTATSMWRISRFKWVPASQTIDPASEEVLIQQFDPHGWHNGGALAFDNNGYLLITCGDGGTNHQGGAWRDQGFFSGVLRIDVDNNPERSHPIRRQPRENLFKPAKYPASFTQGYGIPNDNPWISTSGSSLEEFYALGLRSPHSAFYDAVEGDLWIGDVGANSYEEINRLAKGVNYGWPSSEGPLSGTGLGRPYFSYDRKLGGCVIGGLRYRGTRWSNELAGRILFGDNVKGTLHALAANITGAPTQELLTTNLGFGPYAGMSNLATDDLGNIYILKLNGIGKDGATIRILERTTPLPDPPSLLSQTGLFQDTASLLPSAALVPYEVASPLWSDGASKRRWIALPNDGERDSLQEQITTTTENWSVPEGTVLVKHFEIPLDARNPSLVKRLETRVIVCFSAGRKYGLTYRWNAQGTDAILLASGEEESFSVADENGIAEQRVWSYPSRANCMECHTDVAGQVLGLSPHQLNISISPPWGGSVNQLEFFNRDQMFWPNLTAQAIAAIVPAKPIDDETIPLEHRVRSYLDSNCAHCHQPGTGVAFFDARLKTLLKNQGLVGAPLRGHFPIPGGSLIKPGDPALSAIHVRASSTVPGIAMPPLGKHLMDAKAMDVLSGYIAGLTEEEFALAPNGVRVTRSSLAGPVHSDAAEFPVTIVLDDNVSIYSWKLQVSGGTVKSITASGSYYYTAIISATAPEIVLQVIGVDANPKVRSSNPLTVTSGLAKPPIPSFPAAPENLYGPFELRLAFSEPATGLDVSDFTVGNGRIEWLIDEGSSKRLIISPLNPADVSVTLADGAVTGTDGQPMGKGISTYLQYRDLRMTVEAESGTATGFEAFPDPAASGGEAMWVPEGSPAGVTSAARLRFRMVLPFSGRYKVGGWTRADDAKSNQFSVLVRSTGSSGSINGWTTNQGPGEIGSLAYHAGDIRSGSGPLAFDLLATPTTELVIYGEEDGTRLDRISLVPARPLGLWSALASSPDDGLKAQLHFTSPVTGLILDDLATVDGQATALSGSGDTYTVTLRPDSSKMAVWLKENTVTDVDGKLGSASAPYFASYPDRTYEEWALFRGLNPEATDDLSDSDGDGIAQIMEYALGMNPLRGDLERLDPEVPSSRGLPYLAQQKYNGRTYLVMTYRRRAEDPTISYQAQFGDEPGEFSPSLSDGVVTPIGDGWEEVRIRDEDASGTDARRFGRLKVTRK